MAINFVVGKPRAGKSYWSFHKLLVEELRTSDRMICTNIAVIPEELAATLQEDYGTDFGIRKRLRILTEEECFKFWWHYGPGLTIQGSKVVGAADGDADGKGPDGKKVRNITVPDFAERQLFRVHFLIDEAHIMFPARRWYLIGDECMYTASQHAKLGDDWTFITQNLKQIDSQLRGLGQEFHYLRNHGKEKAWGGFFKSPNRFSRRMYLEPFTGTQTCEEIRFYKLDPRYAKCYRTEAGVGIVGKLADTQSDKRKALPAWGMLVVLAVIGYLLLQLPSAVGWVFGTVLNTADSAARKVMVGGMPKGPAPVATNGVRMPATVADVFTNGPRYSIQRSDGRAGPQVQTRAPAEGVYVTGIVTMPKTRVYLSDGRVYQEGDPELNRVTKRSVMIDGLTYFLNGGSQAGGSQVGNGARASMQPLR